MEQGESNLPPEENHDVPQDVENVNIRNWLKYNLVSQYHPKIITLQITSLNAARQDHVLPTIVSDESIGSGVRVRGSGQSDLLIGGVIDGIEALQECTTVDEIKTSTTGATNIANNQVNTANSATDLCVKRAGPYLGVWSESVRNL